MHDYSTRQFELQCSYYYFFFNSNIDPLQEPLDSLWTGSVCILNGLD